MAKAFHHCAGIVGDGHLQAWCQLFHSLMVVAVYRKPLAVKGLPGGAGHGNGAVGQIIAINGRRMDVGVGHMLPKAAAEIHIQQLAASANAKDRLAGGQKVRNQLHLSGIPPGIQVNGTIDLFAVIPGIDIAAAAKQQRVISFVIGGTVFGEGLAAASGDHIYISPGVVTAGRKQDLWRHGVTPCGHFYRRCRACCPW